MFVVFFFFFKQKTAYEIMPSLVGSEMCIRDRSRQPAGHPEGWIDTFVNLFSDFYCAVAASAAKEPYCPSFANFEEAHRIERTVEAVVASSRLDGAVRVDGEE